ncbi:MAG TPA: ABC transporter permease [Thermoanaerobaculia bacterium]|nr:ABC transporter permease [Thermoanaerobaculia bacterium]
MRVFLRRAAALFRRGPLDAEMDDELRSHIEMAVERNRAAGMTPENARREALRAFGGLERVKEMYRDQRSLPVVDAALQDLRFGLRGFRRNPVFAAVAVLTLAIGIGATTAILSAVNPILFAPLPYPRPGRIAAIEETGRDGSRGDGTFAMYRRFSERARSFEAIAVCRPWTPTVTGADPPQRLAGQRVSADYFRVLGVPPTLGRDFRAPDDRFHGPNVVILSDALWRRRFAGDRAILGRTIELDGDPYSVIGVMPNRFENVLSPSAELWAPLQYDPALPPQGREWGHHLRTVARLRPGTAVRRAGEEVDALGRALITERRPETYDPETRFRAVPLRDELTRGVRPALLAVIGAAALVLVIACVNVTNLLLARGVQRRGEFALRAALGAGRGRLIRQLLTEGVVLATAGGAAGTLLAAFGVRALAALGPPELPRVGAIEVDRFVLFSGLAITGLVAVAFGTIPALQAARSDPHRDLPKASGRVAGGRRRARSLLVVAEVAIALVLLVASGLLLRSIERLFAVPLGFDPSHLLTMQVQESGHRFDTDEARHRFFERALDEVRRVAGVESAALTSQLPLSGDRDQYGASFEATPTRPPETYGAFRYAVSPGYLETMRIPLRRGRPLDEHDGPDAPRVAVISESLAKLQFPGKSPIGGRLRIGGGDDSPPYTIVGVVGDVKQTSLALTSSEAVYTTPNQWRRADGAMSLVVRAHGDAAALAPAVRRAIWAVDRDQPIVRVATMDDLLAASAAERRFVLILFEAFALGALALSAAGIYGVLSGSVAERTREMGVRAALGASRRDILSLVLGQGMKLAGLGIAIGLAAAALSTRAIAALLFGVSRLDPVTHAGVIALLGAVSAIACGLPAWRAARVDPATTLRAE